MTTTPHPAEPNTPGAPAADGATPLPVAAPAGAVTDSDATAALPQTPAPESATTAASSRTPGQPRPLPRTGPIVWGALILVFCGYVTQRAFGSGSLDGDAWVIATLLGLGALLLAVGAAVIMRNRRR